MQLYTLFPASLLCVGALGLVADVKPGVISTRDDDDPVGWLDEDGFWKDMDLCKDSSFNDLADVDGVGHALVKDCQEMIQHLRDHPMSVAYGTGWKAGKSGGDDSGNREQFAPLMVTRTCSFSIHPDSYTHNGRTIARHPVGYVDMADVMDDAIAQFAHDGPDGQIVAAGGQMNCKNSDGQGADLGDVIWRIYKP